MAQTSRGSTRGDLSSSPIYNIKAVTQATGLSAATLRAWERRYGALRPGRSASGYRLYSERDIALLRWLKSRVDHGMAISQAIALWQQQSAEGRRASIVAENLREESRPDLSAARSALVSALQNFDESAADRVLGEAFAAFGVEMVGERVIAPTMAQIGEHWHRGDTSAASEHFASNYLRRKIEAIINAGARREEGPLIVLGCAPNDWHELGLLLVYLFLQRRGHNVLYLGQNVPVAQFVEEMRRLAPAAVLISATTAESVAGLIEMAEAVKGMDAPRPVFGYGGSAFNARPELREQVDGIFMGENARVAVEQVTRAMAERTH